MTVGDWLTITTKKENRKLISFYKMYIVIAKTTVVDGKIDSYNFSVPIITLGHRNCHR